MHYIYIFFKFILITTFIITVLKDKLTSNHKIVVGLEKTKWALEIGQHEFLHKIYTGCFRPNIFAQVSECGKIVQIKLYVYTIMK